MAPILFLPGPRYDIFPSRLSVLRCWVIERHHVFNVFNYRVTRRWHDDLTITQKNKSLDPAREFIYIHSFHKQSLSFSLQKYELISNANVT